MPADVIPTEVFERLFDSDSELSEDDVKAAIDFANSQTDDIVFVALSMAIGRLTKRDMMRSVLCPDVETQKGVVNRMLKSFDDRGLKTIKDLIQTKESDLIQSKHIGEKTLNQLNTPKHVPVQPGE